MTNKRKKAMEEVYQQIRSGDINLNSIDFSTGEEEQADTQRQKTMEQVYEQVRSGNIDMSKIDFGKSIIDEDNKEDTSGWFKKSKAYDDNKGNWLSDTVQTIGSTAGDIGTHLTKGIMNIGEGIGDLITYGRAQYNDNIGNTEKANELRQIAQINSVDELFKPIQEKLDENSILGDKSDNIVESLGYVAGMTAVGIATGGAGTVATTATTFSSAMGQGMNQAYEEGANNDDAWKFGVISGLAEAGSELLFGGLGKASGALGLSKGITSVDDALAQKVSGIFKTTLGKNLSEYVIKAGAEGTEEVISGFIQALGQKITYKSKEDLGKLVNDQNLLEQFISGAITSAIAQVPGQNGIYKTTKNGRDFISGLTQNEAKVYDKELSERTNETKRKNAIEKAYYEQIKTQEKLGINLTNEDKTTIRQAVEEAYNSGKIDVDTKISSKEYKELEDSVRKDLEEGNISLDRIRETLGENKDISKDIYLQKSYYEEGQKGVNYQVKKTDNEKINILYQSAADAGMNNNNVTRRKVELIAKLAQDTDRQYKFASPEQLKEMGYNENANGVINKKTGEILINSHSEKGIQALIGHETVHIFDDINNKDNYTKEYNDLQQYVIEYAKSKGIYETKVKSIIDSYGSILQNENQINEELTADLVGELLFTDEKFIENLSTKNRNVFQKIYDYIKHVVKLAKTNNQDARALENIRYKFDKVYKTISEETNTDLKYSKKLGGYNPEINISTDNISKYEIKDINNKEEVTLKVLNKLKDTYLSTNETSKPITNIDTGMKIEIRQKGIRETFGNDKYYKNIPYELKKAKIATMDHLAKMIKYGEIRAKEALNYHDINSKVKYAYLTSPITIDGKKFNVNMDIRKSPKGDNRFYIHSLEIQKEDNSLKSQSDLLMNESSSNNSITETSKNVNDTTKYSMSESEKNSGSFSMQDSKGRNLTKEQQEYFKDSKVRNENGKLLTVYHGSNSEFTIFDAKKSGQASKESKVGFWFTETKEGAENFANSLWYGDKKARTYETYLNIKNPKIYDTVDNSVELKNIDNKIEELKTVLRKLENKNIAIEINKNELKWANESELEDIAKYEGIDYKDAKQYHDVLKEYNQLEKEYDNKRYNDSYEKFRSDIYAVAGKSASDANFGGTGMWLENENEIISKFKQQLIAEGYDGIIIKGTKYDSETMGKNNNQYVAFYPEQIKKVNNINPTDNPDIRFSMTNDNYITGDDIAVKDMLVQEEKKTIEDSVGENINNSIVNQVTQSKEAKEIVNKYKLMEIGKREYEKLLRREKPTEKEKITVDRLLKGEIENDEIPTSVNRQRVVDLYNAKAKYYNTEKELKLRRKEVINNFRNLAKDMTKNISNWKDKKMGILYQVNTMKRNLRDIIPDKAEADAVYNEYFKPITKNNAIIEKEINKYNERISKYKINEVESQYIQMIGENKYNPDSKLPVESIEKFYNENSSKIDINKCNEAVEEFRKIYDELIIKINDVLIENGYKPIEYRKGYYPHFIEDKAETMLGKFAEKLGWKINKDTIPTDIAGITDQFKPGKRWTSFSQHRKGDTTDYNALKGYDNYIRAAMDVIYHTTDIQKLRALENEIRYQYSEKGIQEQIDEIYDNNELSIEEKEQQIDDLLDNTRNNPMGNLATELRNYTNNLANKKETADRGMEQALGRQTYSIMTNIQNRVSANMVGANISSAITNFIPITQAWSQTSTKSIMKGIKESIAIQFKDDGFSEKSTFLTNRNNQADRLYKTGLEKINDKLGYMFEVVDNFTSNVIVRAKYYDNIDSGMNEIEAIENADEFAKDVMAGRSKGDMPTIFNKKSPLTKLFTAFQLEVNNQYGYMLKDIPVDLGGEAKEKLVAAFVKMFLGAFLYNMFSEKITGRKSAFSPIDIALDSYNTVNNEEMSVGDKLNSIGTDLIGEAPFIGGIAGGGRLPIQGAIPYNNPFPMVSETISKASDLFDGNEQQKQTAIKSLTKEWSKPFFYVALPFAGGQLKKTIEGIDLYSGDKPVAGSYTDSGDLRYTVDEDVGSKVQAAIFGTYANPYAQDYINSGYKTIKADNIDEMVGLDMNSTEYRNYKKGLSAAGDISDKNGYKQYIDDSENVYWYDSENDIVYNSDYKKTIIDKDDLTKVSKAEEQLNYINSLDISDEKKNIMANNINKNSKKKIDMAEYSNYDSYDEYKYARDYPEKYNVINQISSYDDYQEYDKQISNIAKKYKELGEEATTSKQKTAISKQKKKEIQSYIENLPLNQYQKIMLEKEAGGYSISTYKNQIYNYLEEQDLTSKEKYNIWKELFE